MKLWHSYRPTFVHDSRISNLAERMSKTKIATHIKSIKLEIGANDATGEDVDPLPRIKYILPVDRV